MTRRGWLALLLGAAGIAGAGLGFIWSPQRFYPGWLAAVTILAAWPLGSMALLLIHALTGGAWGNALRPALRGGICTLPLLALAAVPLIPGMPSLYVWARPHEASLPGNGFYLNPPFFAVRALIYLIVWCGLAAVCLRARNLAGIAPAGLFLLAITASFAAIDTTMSLDPHFSSSIYGMLTGAGMVLMALSMAVLLSAATAPASTIADFGKLLLALAILWIYLDFMQLLIIWQSDLAVEAPWYLARSHGAWGALRMLIAVGHFLLPFCLLLSPSMQRSRRVVVSVAALLVGMEILRGWWIVLPGFGRFIDVTDVCSMIGLGGIALATAPLFARHTRAHRA